MGTALFPSVGSPNGSPVSFVVKSPEVGSISILSTILAIEFSVFQSAGNRVGALYKGET
jgi:hypothetical protein